MKQIIKPVKFGIFLILISMCTIRTATPATKIVKDLEAKILLPAEKHSAKFTILYDNYEYHKEAKSDWGFSCLIESNNKTILFDTGAKEDILKHNVEKFNVDLTKIDFVVISHEHWDHFGGLKYILTENPDITVYLPSSFSECLNK